MAKQKEDVRFGVVIQELGEALVHGKGDHCLDLNTGAIVPAANCPVDQTGEGRPALRQGKRFVRIPTFDELYEEFKQQLDNDQRLQERKEAKHLVPRGKRRDYLEWCDFLREENAKGIVACRWVASLRPDFKVAMIDEANAVLLAVYDPEAGEWVDECR